MTTVSDTLAGADGLVLNGSIQIDYPSMTLLDGTTVQKSVQKVNITNGALSLPLYPNDTSYPSGTSYRVSYNLNTKAGTLSYIEYWVIPTSPSVVSVASVRTTSIPVPNLLYSCNQLPNGCSVSPGYYRRSFGTGVTSLTITSLQHGLGPNILVQVFDANNIPQEVNQSLSSSGNVTLSWDVAFSGYVLVYSGSGFSQNYSYSFSSVSSLSLVGGSNPINSAQYAPQCYDGSGAFLDYSSYTLDAAYNVTLTFGGTSTGRCVFGRF